ncbi:RpiR family transcriptional regulator [Spirochaetia bacterium]|nr:RpiR family transcriptional regulator [Spirochaetia bacterium]
MESALFAIRQFLPDLPATERRIAQYVLEEPQKVLHYNISELAQESGVSLAAIVRFCRRIGMDGFSDFKIRLSQDVFRSPDQPFLPDLELKPNMEPALVVKGVIGSIQRSMARLESLCDIHLLNRSAEFIASSRFTGIFGIGASGLVAQDFSQKLIRIGIPCANSQDADLQITAACNLRPGDTACVISYSGENESMISTARWAKKNGASLITITRETDNTLRKLAEIPLLVPSMENIYRMGATVSRITQMAVIDMIYALLVSKNQKNIIRLLEQTMAATHYRS